MSFTRYLAIRYLFGKHRIPFIAFISRTTMIGMALGVTTLVLSLGVMRGFESVVTSKIIGFDTHIRIEKLFDSGLDLSDEIISQIAAIPGVEEIFQIKRAEVMLKANGITEGALLEAMPKTALGKLYSVSSNLRSDATTHAGLILGAAMAEQLQVQENDRLLVYDLGSLTDHMGYPRIARSQVESVYESGMVDYDKSYLYASLETMEELFPGNFNENNFGIFLSDLALTDKIIKEIDAILPYSHLSISWHDRHQTLFNWMKTQQLPIFVIFSLIMLVAIVNIASTLILIIMEKRSEIGTLRALGASRGRIRQIFAFEGLMMGVTGTLAGVLFSIILAQIQSTFGVISLPSDVYFMDTVTIQISGLDLLVISCGIIILSVVSALLPALKASRMSPAQALRGK